MWKTILNWVRRVHFKMELYFYSLDPAKSKETVKTYRDDESLISKEHKILLMHGGTYEESRIYYDNGKLLSLSQRTVYKKDVEIRYTSWSASGHKKLDFAARNNENLYFIYYPAYYRGGR
jgi:type 1 glutamine amidotransferase